MTPNLDNFDLSLLPVVRSLVKYKSTKATALHLGISQASVSRNVAKINQAFGQNLFTRSAHGMEASPLARRLASVTDQMLAPLQNALDELSDFDATLYSGDVSLVIDPYILEEQADALTKACADAFPNAKLSFDIWHPNAAEGLKSGDYHYCITDQDIVLPQAIYQEKLYEESAVIIAREHHPILSAPFDLSDIQGLPIVSIPAPDGHKSTFNIEGLFRNTELEPNIVLQTLNLRSAASYLKNSDAIMFGSPSSAMHYQGIETYSISKINVNLPHYDIYGGFSQIKRNNPLTQHVHSVIQGAFRNKQFPFQ
ncbi:LysR family transcriptional regulator [Vibrio sp. SCSIO 43140]|uniref:LysR family transcriptional regulator n=1 Tax=Vibrio sp. SCSIO 43140 TaxID=2819100 RepID=UPI0020750726|nr:LysR family transcriptional regulator [Vibrio sp. SCSIO 43140]USD59567.1 LysR family transcriptional regulator [Vibrio sp. SCSIO 43140]